MGLRLKVEGAKMHHGGAYISNHTSWIDIFTMNAVVNAQFVAKSEVASWPGVGALAKAVGTIFIKRERAEAAIQRDILFARLEKGDRLLFFPEGTTTDGRIILPFKSTLFAALFGGKGFYVQPFVVVYTPPEGKDDRIYNWWSDISFLRHLLWTLTYPKHGVVKIRFGNARQVEEFSSRKEMSEAMERQTRHMFEDLKSKH